MQVLKKPIQNKKENPYLDWIKCGKKSFEGRLKSKIDDWGLEIGKVVQFYDQDDPSSFVTIRITELPIFSDFGEAFDSLGEKLIPNRSREEVIELYNGLFHYPDEELEHNKTSKMILDNSVVAIGFEII